MKKPIEPVRCVCGRRPSLGNETNFWHEVICMGDTVNGWACWVGPRRKTRSAAVRAWDRVMNAARQAKEKR